MVTKEGGVDRCCFGGGEEGEGGGRGRIVCVHTHTYIYLKIYIYTYRGGGGGGGGLLPAECLHDEEILHEGLEAAAVVVVGEGGRGMGDG